MAIRWMTLSVAAVVAFLGGCGSLLNGPRQTVRITTVPPRARVTVDGWTMTSPASIDLDRSEDHRVTAELDGFEPARRTIESHPDFRPSLYNCLIALCIPQLWESERATHYRLEPEQLDIQLDPLGWSPR